MALIFCVVFAVLGFVISFLYEKFLAVEGSGSGTDFSTPAPADAKKNHTVDIVIQDEDLPSDDNASQYYVGSKHFMLTPEDIGAKAGNASGTVQAPYRSSPASDVKVETVKNENKTATVANIEKTEGLGQSPSANVSNADNGFVPIRNLETLYNVSGKEAVTVDSVPQVQSPVSTSAPAAGTTLAADDELDTLPDLENTSLFDSDSPTRYYSDENVNTSSDFATGGVRSKNVEQPEVKDAELMAKAISSILSNES